MDNDRTKGHIFALITVFIWGTTFISTKTLLKDFSPVEILFFRFVYGASAPYRRLSQTASGSVTKGVS